VEIPTVGPDDVLVKIHAATTCGTDLKTYLRGYPKLKPPVRFGHELAGEIVEIGKDVSGFRVGQRVVPHNSAPCGTCFYCKHEQYNLCPDLFINWGAFADYILIPGPIVRLNMYPIPDHLSYAQASVMEPLSTVVHGQRVCPAQKGEIVAIIGAGGPIGLMHLQLALRSGASKVIAFDLKDTRLKTAQELGATHVYNPQTVDVAEAIKGHSEGRGADVVIEATGSIAGWEEAIRIARPGGRVLLFGGLPSGSIVQMDATKVHYGELKIYGVFHSTPQDVYTAYRLICDGVINTQALITCELPLERLEDALLRMKEGEIIKAAICPELTI
jgi:L-iditol 2-dehydrogenase